MTINRAILRSLYTFCPVLSLRVEEWSKRHHKRHFGHTTCGKVYIKEDMYYCFVHVASGNIKDLRASGELQGPSQLECNTTVVLPTGYVAIETGFFCGDPTFNAYIGNGLVVPAWPLPESAPHEPPDSPRPSATDQTPLPLHGSETLAINQNTKDKPMGMSIHVVGFKPADEKWDKMKRVFDACNAAGVPTPADVARFFEFEDPGNKPGMEVKLGDAAQPFRGEGREGLDVDISKLPKCVTVLRFFNAY